ncbi:MFS transporter [Agarilytica rhodophyticola]|uniref:MFS transporter n=1 Tax=Agarilytica rhodophyticola TaxID=1737490 RepID=UPI001FEAC9FE|nr:MFS transporter [Agarilytica rhodophyticola]
MLFSCAESCRLLTGAFHVIYLLSTGIELRYLFLLQATFSISNLISEIYSIRLTAVIGPRWALIMGVNLWGLYFFLCLFSPNIFILVFAYAVYGCGFSLVNGSFEQWLESCIINNNENKSSSIDYMRMRRKYFSLLNVVVGFVGALFVSLSNSYYIAYVASAILLFTVSYFLCLIPYVETPKKINCNNDKTYKATQKDNIILDKKTSLYFLIAIITSILFMPILHLWQPLFENIYSGEILGFSIETAMMLGLVFSSYNLFNFIFNHITIKIKQHQKKWIDSNSSIFSVILLSLSIYATNNNFILTCLLFSLSYCFLSQIQIIHRSRAIVFWSDEKINQVLSYSNFLSRIFTASIWLFYFNFLQNGSYKTMFSVSILCLILIYPLNYISKKINN